MGSTYDRATCLKALKANNSNLQLSINYLLEGGFQYDSIVDDDIDIDSDSTPATTPTGTPAKPQPTSPIEQSPAGQLGGGTYGTDVGERARLLTGSATRRLARTA